MEGAHGEHAAESTVSQAARQLTGDARWRPGPTSSAEHRVYPLIVPSRFPGSSTSTTRVLASLYALELSALLASMAITRKGDRSFFAFSTSLHGAVFLAATVVLALAVVIIIRETGTRRSDGFRWLAASLVLNAGSIAVGLITVEITIRLFAVNSAQGPVFANAVLPPRSWEAVAARNRAILAKAAALGSFLVYDSELGWTVGASRRSGDYNLNVSREFLADLRKRSPRDPRANGERGGPEPQDGIYVSSREGIRSPRIGLSFAGIPARFRVALVGDSFTFGLEVPYDQTWGHQLELALGAGTQVLNFGVDGYGVDQAFLRYQRDVLPWRPRIVILGIIDHDLERTMCVYGFLCFPTSEIPFPKPRFLVQGNRLTRLNQPLPTPDAMFAARSILDLPFIQHDRRFDPVEWEWRFYHHAYSIRLLLSKYRRWPEPAPTVSDAMLRAVNGGLLRAFVQLARENGARPIVVYFPSTVHSNPDATRSLGFAREVLQANHIPYLDMTDCVNRVDPAERFAILHYSAATNLAVARCLRDSIGETGAE